MHYSLPEVLTVDALDRLRNAREQWDPAVRAIARDHGLSVEHIECLDGSNLVVGVGPDHVIKLIPSIYRREYEGELGGLTQVTGALPVRTPQICASGALGAWTYIVMTRLPGEPLGPHLGSLTSSEMRDIVYTVGSALRALHAIPAPTVGSLLTESWNEFVATQSALCKDRQIGWGVHQQLAEGIPDCLARAKLGDLPDRAVLHADLTSWNVMVENLGGRWEMTGIIDFADVRLGAPVYDLSPPALLIARSDRDLFRTLLDGYGMATDARKEALQDQLMAAAILHPFGDLTRNYDVNRPPSSLNELRNAMFPCEGRVAL
jgi:hygromycin-B 7''-O-kinase